ncbi:hypothetical protein V5799_005310 [Amblyomma americanum]|uniref:Uncharacterized protein n=1 Tax=Amblyomma americanum TaxID=6943 RepID=A0AAQ4DZL9_AMBAM
MADELKKHLIQLISRSKKGSRHGCTTFDPTSTESPCGSETGSLHSASHLFLSRASPLVSEASPLGFAPA